MERLRFRQLIQLYLYYRSIAEVTAMTNKRSEAVLNELLSILDNIRRTVAIDPFLFESSLRTEELLQSR